MAYAATLDPESRANAQAALNSLGDCEACVRKLRVMRAESKLGPAQPFTSAAEFARSRDSRDPQFSRRLAATPVESIKSGWRTVVPGVRGAGPADSLAIGAAR